LGLPNGPPSLRRCATEPTLGLFQLHSVYLLLNSR
jgi:hypothetical protein